MRRKLMIGAVAALAASLWVAPAANANGSFTCDPGPQPEPSEIATIGPGEIKVYPANAAGYAGAMGGWIARNATCAVEETAQPAVRCVLALAKNRPTVSIDPETFEVTIEFGEFTGTECQSRG